MNPDGPERGLDPHRETHPDPSNFAGRRQDHFHKFALFWNPAEVSFPKVAEPNTRRAIWRAKKVFAEIIHDVTALEGNPFTLPEIQTLLDGVTVGGKKISDAEQVLNQRSAFLYLFDLVQSENFAMTPVTACEIQRRVARGEAMEEGVFRTGKVGIGATYQPPTGEPEALAKLLESAFVRMATEAEALENPFERGMVAFLHVARQQCFWDGNKRTGRLLMNGVLLAAGQDIITVAAADQLEFNQKMHRYYESGDGTEMMNFLSRSQIRSKFE